MPAMKLCGVIARFHIMCIRVVDVAKAFKSGSDYIVVGRPIKNAENRYEAATNIQKIIKKTFEAV